MLSEALALTFAGDLGVQRGLLRWILSLHQPEFRIEISPKKLPDPNPKRSKKSKAVVGIPQATTSSADIESDKEAEPEGDELPSSGSNGLPSVSQPLTPSVTQILARAPDAPPPPLPAGLTVASLRSRLDGKKKIKYVPVAVVREHC
jgi:DNA-3-methyladenine glycosylase II